MFSTLPKCFGNPHKRQVLAMLYHRPSYLVSEQVMYNVTFGGFLKCKRTAFCMPFVERNFFLQILLELEQG